jgi:hypothetical protein
MGCSWFNTETNKRKTSINNKNTKTKTKSDMKMIKDFFTSIGEERAPRQIHPKDLDSIMARFFLCVLPIHIRQIYDECLLF